MSGIAVGSVIAAIASRVVGEYVSKKVIKKKDAPSREPDVQSVLETLVANKLFPGDIPELKDAAAFPLAKLQAAVKLLEERLGLSPADGIIDSELVALCKRVCLGAGTSHFGPQTRTSVDGPKDPDGLVPTQVLKDSELLKRRRLFVYDVVGDLPDVVDAPADPNAAQACLTTAFHLWQQAVYVRVRKFDRGTGAGDEDKIKPNLIIRMQSLDGQGSKLAEATVGVPGVTSFDLVIDSRETWTKTKLTATLAHEIGHLLGLDHSFNSSTLMYGTMKLDASGDPAIKEPQPIDIALAQDLWGPAPV